MSLKHNERIKLFATALSNTAVATVVTAFIAPIAAYLYGTPSTNYASWPISIIWLLGGLVLHICAQVALGRLRE
jgi:hypothetical protein